jgi:hypothetical protein
MQLVMMRIPATDGNTCKKIPLSWDNNEPVSQNYSKQGSSDGYRRLFLEETENNYVTYHLNTSEKTTYTKPIKHIHSGNIL